MNAMKMGRRKIETEIEIYWKEIKLSGEVRLTYILRNLEVARMTHNQRRREYL